MRSLGGPRCAFSNAKPRFAGSCLQAQKHRRAPAHFWRSCQQVNRPGLTSCGQCIGSNADSRRLNNTLCRAEPEQKSASDNNLGETSASRSGEPSTSGQGQEAILPPLSTLRNDHNTTWARLLLAYPLEMSAAGARTNALWLKRRKRSRWWSRGQYPKVPVYSHEELEATLPEPVSIWHKLVPLAIIFFCASFNLTMLQNLRDAIMVTEAGAETLPFLASLGVLPASLAFLALYGRMVEHLPSTAVFYVAILPLVAFYGLFATVLYPAAAWLHPHGMYASLAAYVPVGLHGLLKMIENWVYSLFFCAGELWGGVVISVLFWTLANEVCSVTEAKTIYPLMGISANVALVVAGNYMKWVNKTLTQGSMILSLRYLVSTIAVLTGLMMLAKAYVDKYICVPIQRQGSRTLKPKKKKKKGSLKDSLEVLRSSPMILNLALLVISYGVSHRLFEFAWKGQLRVLYPSAQAYQGILADVSIYTGYLTIGLMLGGRFVFQYLGWKIAALATPAIMFITGSAFFGLSIAASMGATGVIFGGVNLATGGALAGAVTQVFARSSKFSLFDPAKEMVYIEMDKEEKSKGKAAVDLVGSQIGKSGASWITQALLLVLGSIQAAMPLIAGVFVTVISAWLLAVNGLGQQMLEHDKFQHLQRKEKKAQKSTVLSEPATPENSNGKTDQSAWPGTMTMTGTMSDDEDFPMPTNGSRAQPSAVGFGNDKGRTGEVSFAAQGQPGPSADSKKEI